MHTSLKYLVIVCVCVCLCIAVGKEHCLEEHLVSIGRMSQCVCPSAARAGCVRCVLLPLLEQVEGCAVNGCVACLGSMCSVHTVCAFVRRQRPAG